MAFRKLGAEEREMGGRWGAEYFVHQTKVTMASRGEKNLRQWKCLGDRITEKFN